MTLIGVDANMKKDLLDAAMLSGDLDALDKLIEEGFQDEDEDAGTDGEQAKTDEGEADEFDEANEANEGEAGKDDGAQADASKADEAARESSTQASSAQVSEIKFDENGNAIVPKELLTVIAKDGKHAIPYGVLEDQRTKAAALEKALNDERKARESAENALSKGGRQAELLKKQLQDAGIDPEQLPEDIELTDDILQSLDDYGDLGKIIKKLVAKQTTAATARSDAAAAQEAPAGTQEPSQEFKNFYQSNAEFRRIMDSEGDEFDTLDHFYKKVSSSSEFKGKPFDVVAGEALRRTQLVYGGAGKEAAKDDTSGTDAATDDRAIAAAAAAKVAAAKANNTPASPSEVGASQAAALSAIDRAKAASGMDLLNTVGELTAEEMEQLFSQL